MWLSGKLLPLRSIWGSLGVYIEISSLTDDSELLQESALSSLIIVKFSYALMSISCSLDLLRSTELIPDGVSSKSDDIDGKYRFLI